MFLSLQAKLDVAETSDSKGNKMIVVNNKDLTLDKKLFFGSKNTGEMQVRHMIS